MEKKIITQSSAEGGASRSYVVSCESRNHPSLTGNMRYTGDFLKQNVYFKQYLLEKFVKFMKGTVLFIINSQSCWSACAIFINI